MNASSKRLLSLVTLLVIVLMLTPMIGANVVDMEVKYEEDKVRIMAKYEDGTEETATRGATQQKVTSEEEKIKQLQLAEKTRLTLHENLQKGMSAQEALDSLSAGSVIAVTNESCVKAGGNPNDCLTFYTLDGTDLFGGLDRETWTEIMSCSWTDERYEFKSLDPWFHILNTNQIVTHNQVLVRFGATTYYRVYKTGTCEEWEVGPDGPISKIGDVPSQAQEDGYTESFDGVALSEEMSGKVQLLADAGDGRMILLWPTSYDEFHLMVDVTLASSLFGEHVETEHVVKKYRWEEKEEEEFLRIIGSSAGGGGTTQRGRFPGR